MSVPRVAVAAALLILVVVFASLAVVTIPPSLPSSQGQASPRAALPSSQTQAVHGSGWIPSGAESGEDALDRGASIPHGSPTVITIGAGSYPRALGYDSEKNEVFVANEYSDNVSVISDSSDKIVATVSVENSPVSAAYDSDKGEVFVADSGSSDVSVISDLDNTVVANVTVGDTPSDTVFDSGKGEVFVTDWNSNNVEVISDTNNSVVATISVPGDPFVMTYDPAQGSIFVSDPGANTVTVISDSNNTVIATLHVGDTPNGLAYDSHSGDVYVANIGSDNLSIISATTNKVVGSFTDTVEPLDVGADAAAGEVLVSNYDAGTLNEYSDSNYTLTAYAPIGQIPYGIVYDSGTSQIFTANSGSDTVSVISLLPPVETVSATASVTSGPAYLTVNFTATAVGGTGSYNTWAWSFGDGATAAVQDPTHTYTKPGSYPVNVSVNDSAGVSALSPTIWINVTHPTAFTSSLVASRSSVEIGESVWFNVSTVGGVGPFAFIFQTTPASAGCTSPTGPALVCTPTSTPLTLAPTVKITDAYGATSNSTSSPVTVGNVSLTIVPSASEVEVGAAVWFNSTITGDVSSLTYSYGTSSAAGCTSTVGPSLRCVPTTPGGELTVLVNATDRFGNVFSEMSPSVSVGEFNLTVAPSTGHVEVGAPVWFNSTITGDASPATFAYSSPAAAGCATSSGPSLRCDPVKAGWSFAVLVTATDAYGNLVSETSATVSTGAVSVLLSTTRSAVDVGQPFTISTTATGDLSPLSFAYNVSSSIACTSSDAPSASCAATSEGSGTVLSVVTDAYGNSWTSNVLRFAISPALLDRVSLSSTTPLLGQNIAIIVNASGGEAPYAFSFTGLPPGCVSVNESSLGCLPTQAGSYNISAEVHDQNGMVATSRVSMTVLFDFNVVAPTTTAVGHTLTIQVNLDSSGGASSGFGDLTYAYSGLPPGCTSMDTPTLTCTPTQVGTYEVTVSVHDEVGDHNSHTVAVQVVPASSGTGLLGLAGNDGYYLLLGVVVVAGLLIVAGYEAGRRGKHGESPSSNSDPLSNFKRPPTAQERERTKVLSPGQTDPAEDLF